MITYVIAYLLAFTTALRGILQYYVQPAQWMVYGLLDLFCAAGRRTMAFTARGPIYPPLPGGQAVVIAMLLIVADFADGRGADYFSVLFASLAVQAMYVFPPSTGFRWIGVFCVVATTLMLCIVGWDVGLALAIQMSVVYVFIGAFMAVTGEAEEAHEQSQKLLTELQAAHDQLQL